MSENNAVVGFDMDGCLADFDTYMKRVAKDILGVEIPKDQIGWNMGLTPKQSDRIMDHIVDEAHQPWYLLGPLEPQSTFDAIRDAINSGAWRVYFITHRYSRHPGSHHAQLQTANWLVDRGIPHPSVIIGKDKGRICRALGVDYFIDDRPVYCLKVRRDSPGTKVFCIRCRWNKHAIERSGIRKRGVTVVNNVNEFIWHVFTGQGLPFGLHDGAKALMPNGTEVKL